MDYLLQCNFQIKHTDIHVDPLYEKALQTFTEVYCKEPKHAKEIIYEKINNNQYILVGKKQVFYKELVEKHCDEIHSWIDGRNKFLTYNELKTKYYLTTFTQWTYNQIISAIPQSWKRTLNNLS